MRRAITRAGRGVSPTDLVATALGTCMLTTMGIAARRKGWVIDGIELHVQKGMTTEPPRRIRRLGARFTVPKGVAQALNVSANKSSSIRLAPAPSRSASTTTSKSTWPSTGEALREARELVEAEDEVQALNGRARGALARLSRIATSSRWPLGCGSTESSMRFVSLHAVGSSRRSASPEASSSRTFTHASSA